MSALASLERFGEKYLVFLNWRLCRNCLQNEWHLFFLFCPREYPPTTLLLATYSIENNSSSLKRSKWQLDSEQWSIEFLFRCKLLELCFWKQTTIYHLDDDDATALSNTDISETAWAMVTRSLGFWTIAREMVFFAFSFPLQLLKLQFVF